MMRVTTSSVLDNIWLIMNERREQREKLHDCKNAKGLTWHALIQPATTHQSKSDLREELTSFGWTPESMASAVRAWRRVHAPFTNLHEELNETCVEYRITYKKDSEDLLCAVLRRKRAFHVMRELDAQASEHQAFLDNTNNPFKVLARAIEEARIVKLRSVEHG